MDQDLAEKKCKACEFGEGKLGLVEIEAFTTHVPLWKTEDGLKIFKRFKFKDFKESLAFVNEVGTLAENEGHHPDITFGWGYVKITLSTHAVDGLSENDFILAAKIDKLV